MNVQQPQTSDTQEVVDLLNSLIKLDVDAVRAYTQALAEIENTEVYTQLSVFRSDHERHIRDLSAAVASLGGAPVAPTPDLKGFLLEGFTAIRSVTGTMGALRAMRMNEGLTNARYDAALSRGGLPLEIRELLRRNDADEKRHMEYIDMKVAALGQA